MEILQRLIIFGPFSLTPMTPNDLCFETWATQAIQRFLTKNLLIAKTVRKTLASLD